MPTEEGIGLNQEKRLFPVPGSPRKHDEKHPIGPGTSWALHLTAKGDQLLSQQGVFGDELGLGASEIGERRGQSRSAPGARPAQYTLLDAPEGMLASALECNEQGSHDDIGSFKIRDELRDEREAGSHAWMLL